MTPADSGGSGSPGWNDDQAQALMELADGLMERARTLASQTDQMIAALDLAAKRLLEAGRGVETSPIVVPVRLLQRAPAPTERNHSDTSAAATEDVGANAAAVDSEQPVSDGIRLLITTMALAGTGHDEIARRLREDFGFEDADRVIKKAGV